MPYGQFSEQQPGYGYGGSNNSNQAPYFPNDIDLETMPELLPCDVDEVSTVPYTSTTVSDCW